MRAREFLTEESQLPPEVKDPMAWAFELPGLDTSNPYKVYRLGLAIARARSDSIKDHINPYMPDWTPHSAAGECAVVVGMNKSIEPIIDKALSMIDVDGGKIPISTPGSQEPKSVAHVSPVRPFGGYPR